MTPTFNEILEASQQLPIEEQENLVQILENRLREKKRNALVEDVTEAQEEFAQGKCQSVTPEQLMKEILS